MLGELAIPPGGGANDCAQLPRSDKDLREVNFAFGVLGDADAGGVVVACNIFEVAGAGEPTFDGDADGVAVALVVGNVFSRALVVKSRALNPSLEAVMAKSSLAAGHARAVLAGLGGDRVVPLQGWEIFASAILIDLVVGRLFETFGRCEGAGSGGTTGLPGLGLAWLGVHEADIGLTDLGCEVNGPDRADRQ